MGRGGETWAAAWGGVAGALPGVEWAYSGSVDTCLIRAGGLFPTAVAIVFSHNRPDGDPPLSMRLLSLTTGQFCAMLAGEAGLNYEPSGR